MQDSFSNNQNPSIKNYDINMIGSLVVPQPIMQQMANQNMSFNEYIQPNYSQFPMQYDNYYNEFYEKFSKDLEKFYSQLADQREAFKEPRRKIIEHVNQIVDEIDIIERFEIYGSYKTELDLPSSDIDFAIYSQHADGSEGLKQLHDKITNNKYKWIEKINYIPTASVPIIKIDTIIDNYAVKVDISYKDEGHKGNDSVELPKGSMYEYLIKSLKI